MRLVQPRRAALDKVPKPQFPCGGRAHSFGRHHHFDRRNPGPRSPQTRGGLADAGHGRGELFTLPAGGRVWLDDQGVCSAWANSAQLGESNLSPLRGHDRKCVG